MKQLKFIALVILIIFVLSSVTACGNNNDAELERLRQQAALSEATETLQETQEEAVTPPPAMPPVDQFVPPENWDPDAISDEAVTIGRKALEIMDDFLNGTISFGEVRDRLDSLERIDVERNLTLGYGSDLDISRSILNFRMTLFDIFMEDDDMVQDFDRASYLISIRNTLAGFLGITSR